MLAFFPPLNDVYVSFCHPRYSSHSSRKLIEFTGHLFFWGLSFLYSQTSRSTTSNSNWTEWSTIQGVIARVISKSDEREARGRFEITSAIIPWIVPHEVQSLINRSYNKIREEYDSGINYLTAWYIQLLSEMLKKITHSSATSARLMTRTVQLLRHDVCNCPINAQIRAAGDQSDLRILI